MEDNFDITAKDLKKQDKFLTTGCSKLDVIFKGGIFCRGITQFYGCAGTGKTQLALQLCLTVQLPEAVGGLAAESVLFLVLPFIGAVYIVTEAVFPIKRLYELIQKLDVIQAYKVTSDAVFVEHISTIEELESTLINKIPLLMNIHKIRLLIIDSIAAPYRVENWNDQAKKRMKSLRIIGQQLHNLCKNNDICIVCINQVSAVLKDQNISDNIEEKPSLGITWSSMITNSIRFYRKDTLRYLCIKLSSYLSLKTIQFDIQSSGVQGK